MDQREPSQEALAVQFRSDPAPPRKLDNQARAAVTAAGQIADCLPRLLYEGGLSQPGRLQNERAALGREPLQSVECRQLNEFSKRSAVCAFPIAGSHARNEETGRHDTMVGTSRRGGRVVECGGLENRCSRKVTQGSNPCLSAIRPFSPSRPRPIHFPYKPILEVTEAEGLLPAEVLSPRPRTGRSRSATGGPALPRTRLRTRCVARVC